MDGCGSVERRRRREKVAWKCHMTHRHERQNLRQVAQPWIVCCCPSSLVDERSTKNNRQPRKDDQKTAHNPHPHVSCVGRRPLHVVHFFPLCLRGKVTLSGFFFKSRYLCRQCLSQVLSSTVCVCLFSCLLRRWPCVRVKTNEKMERPLRYAMRDVSHLSLYISFSLSSLSVSISLFQWCRIIATENALLNPMHSTSVFPSTYYDQSSSQTMMMMSVKPAFPLAMFPTSVTSNPNSAPVSSSDPFLSLQSIFFLSLTHTHKLHCRICLSTKLAPVGQQSRCCEHWIAITSVPSIRFCLWLWGAAFGSGCFCRREFEDGRRLDSTHAQH